MNKKDLEKDRYVLPYEWKKPKDSKGGKSDDMLSHILNKFTGSDKMLTSMKEDVSTLTKIVTSHLVSIKQLNTQECHSSSYVNPR